MNQLIKRIFGKLNNERAHIAMRLWIYCNLPVHCWKCGTPNPTCDCEGDK